MEYMQFEGKTVEEAVEKGLTHLGLNKEQADIRVLEEGKRKLFGTVKARVEIAALENAEKGEDEQATPTAQAQAGEKPEKPAKKTAAKTKTTAKTMEKTDGERTVEFLEGLFSLLHITACTELVSEGEKVEINVTAANTNAVIGKRGVMLDAIQTLAGAVANTGREDYKRVVVDCENYRENREATLNKLADNLAQKATRLAKKIKLEPMNPYERRIIHAALSTREDVKTLSEGKEPNRYIVVIPNNLEDPTADAIPARSERRNDRSRGRDGRRGGYQNRSRDGRGGAFQNRGRNGGYKKAPRDNANRGGGASGGTSLKSSSDFFGIFLGNSNDTSDKE